MQPKAWSWICVTEIVIYFYSFRIRLIELKINSIYKYFLHSLTYICVFKWLSNIQAECASWEIQWKSSWKLWEKRWGKSKVIPCPSVLCGITHKQRGGKLSSRDETFCFEMSWKGVLTLCPVLLMSKWMWVWERRSVADARAIVTKSSHLNSIAVGKFSIKPKRKWSTA